MTNHFVKAKVRLEGEVNRSWELSWEDGRVEKYYSVEGSAQRAVDDEYVYNINSLLNSMLDGLSYDYMQAQEDQVLEFEVSFKDGLESVVVTHSEYI